MQSEERNINVAIVILAAGKSTRMGGSNKLLADFDGIPLVRKVAMSALGSEASSVTVIVGFQQAAVRLALEGLPLVMLENSAYAAGMGTSLAAAIAAEQVHRHDGVLVLLADMPAISSSDIERLLSAFAQTAGTTIVRASGRGRQGNPVILPKSIYPALGDLKGDVGARRLIETSGLPVLEVDIGEAAHIDVDTPEELFAQGGRPHAEGLRD